MESAAHGMQQIGGAACGRVAHSRAAHGRCSAQEVQPMESAAHGMQQIGGAACGRVAHSRAAHGRCSAQEVQRMAGQHVQVLQRQHWAKAWAGGEAPPPPLPPALCTQRR